MDTDSMPTRPETYLHGHHDSVLRSHRWRTPENSASYLLAHLSPGVKILDVGCGPGTITAGLAALVPQGSVVGIAAASPTSASTSATSTGWLSVVPPST